MFMVHVRSDNVEWNNAGEEVCIDFIGGERSVGVHYTMGRDTPIITAGKRNMVTLVVRPLDNTFAESPVRVLEECDQEGQVCIEFWSLGQSPCLEYQGVGCVLTSLPVLSDSAFTLVCHSIVEITRGEEIK